VIAKVRGRAPSPQTRCLPIVDAFPDPFGSPPPASVGEPTRSASTGGMLRRLRRCPCAGSRRNVNFRAPSDNRGRQPASVVAEQRDQRLIEVAGRDALQVEDRDQHFEALRSTRVRRQNRRRKADAFGAFNDRARAGSAPRPDRRRSCELSGGCWPQTRPPAP
jgi:hypothetical protein